MKAYIITIEDICDMVSYHTAPIVRYTKKDAQQEMRSLAKDEKVRFKSQFNDVVVETRPMSIEIYHDGYYCEDHYTVTIDEVDLPDVKKVRN